MRYENFTLVSTVGERHNTMYYAQVDEVSRPFPFLREKRIRRDICRAYGDSWFFLDTGEFTPGWEVERLERAWVAQSKR
jgi:hypothetical protein